MKSEYELLIIGAGAAGLGASELAVSHGLDHLVLEASHRTGGRGLTETLANGAKIDLGCHWLHSASLNPYVICADKLGFEYRTQHPGQEFFIDGRQRQSVPELELEMEQFYKQVSERGELGNSDSLLDQVSPDSQWFPWLSYWYSLMHSNDIDQVSIQDVVQYNDTGEDWPLHQGYGDLISKQGANCPVQLNTVVKKIDWSGKDIHVDTNKGRLKCNKLIITVSTGILMAGDIEFSPALPDWKQQAIHNLPLGNYNNLFFSYEPGTFENREWHIVYSNQDKSLSIQVGQFKQDYLYACTAGRVAWGLENQGERASEQYFREALVDIFGSDINSRLLQFKASAWGFDPWTKGAYSSLKPGNTNSRQLLSETIEDRILFAGEATSNEFFNTAHGAYLSGQNAIQKIKGESSS